MAMSDGSACRIQSEKQHAQCSEEIRVGLKECIQKRKGPTPSDIPIIKKSKTVCPVYPSDEERINNPQDQRNNDHKTGRAVEQEKIAHLQRKLEKVLHTKVPSEYNGLQKPGLHFTEQRSSASSVSAEGKWINWLTKEPIPQSPVSKATPYQLGEHSKETTACGVDTDVVSINASQDHLDHIYGERGKHCEMVLTLSQKVEPENQSDKIPKFDQLLKEPEGVYKKLHDKRLFVIFGFRRDYRPQKMASCRDCPCDSASCRESWQEAETDGQSLQEAIYQAQQSRQEARDHGQSRQKPNMMDSLCRKRKLADSFIPCVQYR